MAEPCLSTPSNFPKPCRSGFSRDRSDCLSEESAVTARVGITTPGVCGWAGGELETLILPRAVAGI
jgi:hypothetical protein